MERKKIIGQSGSLFACRLAILPASKFHRLSALKLIGFLSCLLFALCSLPSAAFADKLVVKDTNGVEKFVVTDAGLIGMGTLNPTTQVHIVEENGSNFFRGLTSEQNSDVPSATVFLFLRSRGTHRIPIKLIDGDGIGAIHFEGYDGGTYRIVSSIKSVVKGPVSSGSVSGELWFYTAGPILSPKMVISAAGAVGIGTTSPQGTLDVNGTIYYRGLQQYADYVFEPNYRMETIEEHAKYMWENKHLKAVPGVTKDENGMEIVEVGSHQKGILEELEKAHIYIEQLNEKLQALESRLKALEK